MELYKLENGHLKKFKGGFVVLDNRIYTNPTEETIRKAGYKDIVYGSEPEYDEGKQYLTQTYTEDDTKIYVGYEVLDIETLEVE
jgi:hypothetical protein